MKLTKRAELIAMFRALLKARRARPTAGSNYDRRRTYFATDDECDAGGSPVAHFEVAPGDLQLLIDDLVKHGK